MMTEMGTDIDVSGGLSADHGEIAEQGLRYYVARALRAYFIDLGTQEPAELYRMVLEEVEAPLFEKVMERAGGNQSRAAQMLGINRGTLRKKLRQYDI